MEISRREGNDMRNCKKKEEGYTDRNAVIVKEKKKYLLCIPFLSAPMTYIKQFKGHYKESKRTFSL